MPVLGGRGSPPCPGAAPQPRSRPAGGRLLSRLSRRIRAGAPCPGSPGPLAPQRVPKLRAGAAGAGGRPDLSRGAKRVPLLRAPPRGTVQPELKGRALREAGSHGRAPSRGVKGGGGDPGPGWHPACLVWSVLGWGGTGRGRLWGFPPQGRLCRLAGLKLTGLASRKFPVAANAMRGAEAEAEKQSPSAGEGRLLGNS